MILTKGTRKPVNANNVTLKFKNHPPHTDHAIFVSNKDKKLINDNSKIPFDELMIFIVFIFFVKL